MFYFISESKSSLIPIGFGVTTNAHHLSPLLYIPNFSQQLASLVISRVTMSGGMGQNLIFGHHALLKLVLSILHLLIYHKNLIREYQMASKWTTRGPKIFLLAPPPPTLCNSNPFKVVTLCSLVSGHKEPKCSGSS